MSIVFDTESLLIFYKDEPGSVIVEELLNQVIDGSLKAYINIVNLTEFYYILHRYNPKAAEEKTRNLRAYGIQIIPVSDNNLWKTAAEIKSLHPMSLADSYAVATAQKTGSSLVIGLDTEFKDIDTPIIKIK